MGQSEHKHCPRAILLAFPRLPRSLVGEEVGVIQGDFHRNRGKQPHPGLCSILLTHHCAGGHLRPEAIYG